MKKLTFLFFIMSIILLAAPHSSLAKDDLQQMIDALHNGDILELEDKTYEGNITINKSIELIGKEGTVISGDGSGNVISIEAPNVKIRNMTVLGSSMNRNSSEEYAGIKVYSNHNVIDSVTIKHSFHGIYLSQAHHNLIENSLITGLGKGRLPIKETGFISITQTIIFYKTTWSKVLEMACSLIMPTAMKFFIIP